MNILFGSDFHGDEIAFNRFVGLLSEPQFHMGILGGDLFKANEDVEKHKIFEKRMKKKLNTPGKSILFVLGNGDGNAGVDWQDSGYLKNINCRRIIVDNQAFTGYQYSNPLSDSPFEKTEEEQFKDMTSLSQMIDQETILVTHSPAFKVLDWRMRDGRGLHMGSKMLSQLIQSTNPMLHLHGHAHQSTGIEGRSINGAYCDRKDFVSIDPDKKIYRFIK